MVFDFAKAKALARRTVHVALGVRAFYQDASMSAPVEIRARWHDKIEKFGDLDNQQYAQTIEGVDRVVFEAAEARRLAVRRGGTISFPEFGAGLGVTLGGPLGGEASGPPAFTLTVREPLSGPFEEVWIVARKESE